MKTQMIRSAWKRWALVLIMIDLLLTGYHVQKAVSMEIQVEAAKQAAHYIVFEKRADGTVNPVYYRLVELSAPLVSLTGNQVSDTLATSSRNVEQIAVSLQTKGGQIVYQNVIQVSPWLRGEFSGNTPDAPIDGHLVRLETVSFVVRVPQIENTMLILNNDKLQTISRFDMRQLEIATPQIELAASSIEVENIGSASGPASNRVDFLVMGDGYTSAQQTNFNADAAATTSAFFSISPYSVYSNFINIHSLFTASSQSGADHPPYNAGCAVNDPTCCADPAMLSDSLQGTMVSTAFNSRFCVNAIHRLLAPDSSKVLAAAAAMPDWDTILLLVNDSTYGGSGGSPATVSMHSAAAQIAQHEYAHSFVGLADEYESAYPGYPACSDISGPFPCESNVTDVTSLAQIKWKAWINIGTPIPTPNDPLYDGIVGLFQGARYQSTGMYRPGYSCIMRFLGAPYCQVPSQSYVLKLYEGGWGVPANGISLIEPASNTPADPTVNLTHPATQVFHAASLSPVGGPPAQITWLRDSVPIPGANGDTYLYTTSASDPASVHITMRVEDTTPLVIPAMSGGALQAEFTWTIIKSTIFADVPLNYWASSWIERLYNAGITGGCATTPSLLYCPDSTVTRAQMAVFLLKGIHGSSYTPPVVGASTGFTDVAIDYWAAAWIKQLAAEGITGGCGAGVYCPDATVTRAQMAIFLLRAKHGSSYSPPAAAGVFTDVPVGYWADKWIEQLAVEGITGGCGTNIYCPDNSVTRAQMAVFLVRTFNLP